MDNLWLYLSILTTFITACVVILYKFFGSKFNNNPDVILCVSLISLVITGLIAIILIIINKERFKKSIKDMSDHKLHNYIIIFLIVFLGLLHISTITCQTFAVNLAKNPAYSHMITNMNVIIVLLLAFFLFNSPLNYQSCLGIFLCLLGIGLILFNN